MNSKYRSQAFTLCLSLVLAACGSIQTPKETPLLTGNVQNSASAFNQNISDGIVRYAGEHGISELWKDVDADTVGQIQDISADGRWVLFQTADLDAQGYKVPGHHIVLADLQTATHTVLGAAQDLHLRLGAFSSQGKIALTSFEGDLYTSTIQGGRLEKAYTAPQDTYVGLLKWSPDGEHLGFVLNGGSADRLGTLSPATAAQGIRVSLQAVPASKTSTVERTQIGTVEWSGDQLVVQQTKSISAQSWNNTFQAGTVVPLKMPFSRGQATIANGYTEHSTYYPYRPALDFINGEAADGKPVLAVAPGTVFGIVYRDATWCNVFGNGQNAPETQITIEHLGSNNQKYTSMYMHQRISVQNGDVVGMGSTIGTVSCVGDSSNGAGGTLSHIHFAMLAGVTNDSAGTGVLPEPMDGQSDFSAGMVATSSNGGTPPPPIPPPPPPANFPKILLIRADTGYALNSQAYPGMKYSWLFPRNDTDTDQVRELLAPGQAGNAGWMFKRSDGTCLNAYLPSNDSEVISYNCNANDGDQQWDFGYWEAEGAWKLGRIGTNQCIDAPNLYDNGRVHMWSCSPGTGNQRWTLNSFPAPQWQVNNTSVASTGIAGTTPAMQAITVANVGMTYNGQIVGGPASIQIGNPNSWFSVAPGTTSLPRSKEHPNPNTALNINFAACSSTATNAGSFTVSGSGGNTVTVNVSRTCTAAPPPATWALSAAPVLATGTVGGSTTTGTFTASNAGNVAGTYTASATNGFTVSPASGSLNAGASATFTVTAPACTAVATQTSVLTLGGADTKTISLSRACTAAPVPVWSVSGVAAAFPAANVGSAGASTTFTLTNSGLGAGVPTLTSDSPAFITAALADSTPVAPGGTRSVTVSAAACTVAGPQQGTISVSGGGAALAALTTLSRVCLPAVPAAPSSLSVAMSSNGRLFVSWPTSASASSYSFSGSFDGQPLTVSGSAAALSGTRGSAVAAFGTAANDPSKQGKALCMQVQAVNAGGTSAFTAPVCATYQYYTSASLSAQSVESEPTLRLTLP